MDVMPQIRVSFFFSGDKFDLNDVTDRMQYIPEFSRNKEDCPLPEVACTCWSMDSEKESCRAVSIQFEKILDLLIGKEQIILQICNDYNIDVGFLINIFFENGDRPEIVLPKEIVLFAASINAEIGFDLYID